LVLFIDGVLIPAGNLINGTTITRQKARECDELEYFNIKVEGHDVIYAERTPVATMRVRALEGSEIAGMFLGMTVPAGAIKDQQEIGDYVLPSPLWMKTIGQSASSNSFG
jgi:hypothetical protein